MGINNLNNFRPGFTDDDLSSGRRPLSVVTKLIVVTLVVYGLQLLTARPAAQDSLVFDWFALESGLVFRAGQIWRLITYAFCHSETNIMHLVGNMLALYFLGRAVVQTIGRREFVAVYLAAAVFAGIVQVSTMAIWNSGGSTWTIGASGAVSAIFMLFVMHYPRLKLYLFGMVPVEARWLLTAAVVYDGLGFLGLVSSVFTGGGANIGHAAHLGGLIFAYLYFRWDMNLTGWWDSFAGRARPVSLPKTNLRVYNPGIQPDVDYSDRIDDILARISREGEGSLTDRERRVLTQASEHLKSHR
ncbi:MAG: rhomboid family intramembrane serine protease [Planctomycetaceae bacterium]